MASNLSSANASEKGYYASKGLSEFVSTLLESWHVPGISIAVVDGDDFLTEGHGTAELPSMPFSADTLSYAGSTTKAHLAALLALLIASNRYKDDRDQPLSWKTPICSLIRADFVLQDEWATNHITLEDALCHRTGLAKHDNAYPRYIRPEGFGGPQRLITLQEMVRSLRYLPMASEPRTEHRYSNLMFATLSHVIETVTGQWLGNALRVWLWEPLGMKDTHLSLDQALAAGPHVAQGYFWDKDQHQYKPLDRMPTEEVSGSGAVIMSAADMVKWLRFWLREQRPLSPEAHRNLRHPRIPVGAEDPAPFDTPIMYAQAWQTSSYRGHRFWRHHGAMDAFGALVTFFPDLNFGVSIMGNTAFTTNVVAEIVTWHLVDNKLGVASGERHNWTQRWKNTVEQMEQNVHNGLEKIYPNRPEKPIQASLPLSKYAGLYYHSGYKYLKVVTNDGANGKLLNARPESQLHAEQPDNNFRIKCDFVHVSGEKWIMYVDLMDAPTLTKHDFAAVEFRTGLDGEIESMGIEWRARSDVDGWIWYKKIRTEDETRKA
ncbi:hypothetical protein PMG11_07598 [Penicillium brasilianum]|uniref:Penicillin-binding protein n=1 Tax=Penicillium brasilianum TaxID=104259 RepID=A0A0F7TQI4_PENBI|nr:hypothetical protein PMG11_07598 [Penicillium brasilianum]